MGGRKILVVYYSRTGVTKRLALAVAERLGADVEELADTKNRRGVAGIISMGVDSVFRRPAEIAAVERDPGDYDLVVIGTPACVWRTAPAVRRYIVRSRERLPEVAFLVTAILMTRSTLRDMAALCGRAPIARLARTSGQVRKGAFEEEVARFVGELGARDL